MVEPATPPKKSPLIAVGVLLMLLGFVLPRPVAGIARSLQGGFLKAMLLISTDLLRLCFFIGIGVLLIGLVRKRKKV